MTTPRVRIVCCLLVGLAAGCRPPDAGRGDTAAEAYLRIAAAEDARPAGGPALETLLDGERDAAAPLRVAAVRALGRLENPAMAEHIVPLLADPDADVRAEAANAMAQAVHRGAGDPVVEALLARVDRERDAWVRGVVARSLGRLAVDGAPRAEVAHALLVLSHGEGVGADAPIDQLVGTALGMESFARRARGRPLGDALVARLHALAHYGGRDGGGPLAAADVSRAARIRELAVLALGAVQDLGAEDIEAALADPSPAVRRAAAARLPALAAGAGAAGPAHMPPLADLVAAALGDASAQVRMEGVRALARGDVNAATCARLESTAAADADTGVRLAALDALARPCPDRATQIHLLETTAGSLVPGDMLAWHAAAHAVVALARMDAVQARRLLPRFTGHANPFVRMYAARAAGAAGAAGALTTLADDPVANVRTEAAQQLAATRGRAADPVLIRVMAAGDDPQLLYTTAHLLVGTGLRAQAADAALGTLDRVSKARLETMRDARTALLELVETTGDADLLPRVEPYLLDYDEAVASKAAGVMQAWTGKPFLAAPRRPKRLPMPTAEELRAMETCTVVLHMARGGDIAIRLFPLVAPTNALRLYHQARGGVLDGLTFHRVVPNFVIQGGSPGANEYAGHGAFTRDEVGLPVQWRGTVGLSTRGRDTGDGQIYVNLVDDVRLDHDYTVLGVVTSGMDVVDAVLEGDVIERAEVRPGS